MPISSVVRVINQAFEFANSVDWEGTAVDRRLHHDVAVPELGDHLVDVFVDLNVA
jgi:hypothetical protein